MSEPSGTPVSDAVREAALRRIQKQRAILFGVIGALFLFTLLQPGAASTPPRDTFYLATGIGAVILAGAFLFVPHPLLFLFESLWWLAAVVWTAREMLRDGSLWRVLAIAVQLALMIRGIRDYHRLR